MSSRRNQSTKYEKSDDRLGNLPDSLLCHILSFLPTKLSVATSILAKRYRYLWSDVLNVDFDCEEHTETNFVDTVNSHVLMCNGRNINSFRLIRIYNQNFTKEHPDIWIRTIIARNVQTLHIELFEDVCLPRCLFTCNTLVNLRLQYCGSIPDSIISLPNLKRLHLSGLQYGNSEKLQNLISGCPVLEELIIEVIHRHDLRTCFVASPTIKRLKLDFDWYQLDGEGDDTTGDYKMEINTPAVRYLFVQDNSFQCFSGGMFNSLVEADIRLNDYNVDDGVTYCNSVLDLVDTVYQVQSLTLSIGYNEIFVDRSYADVTSRFNNLTKLELAADWQFLLKFLQSADNLEVLIIQKADDGGDKCWTEPQQVPACLSSHLKQVTIHQFEWLEAEFEMVNYMLQNGKVLNKMDIISAMISMEYPEFEKKFKVLLRIAEIGLQSQTCNLQFS